MLTLTGDGANWDLSGIDAPTLQETRIDADWRDGMKQWRIERSSRGCLGISQDSAPVDYLVHSIRVSGDQWRSLSGSQIENEDARSLANSEVGVRDLVVVR